MAEPTPAQTRASRELREAGLDLIRATAAMRRAYLRASEALAMAEAAGIPRADWLPCLMIDGHPDAVREAKALIKRKP